MINRRWRIRFHSILYCCEESFLQLSKALLLLCLAVLCCFFTTLSEGSGSEWAKQSKDTGGAPTYICRYNLEELERYGLHGAAGYTATHLAIKCAMGAGAGAAWGAKSGGVLGAASGAVVGCYFFAQGPGFLDDWLYSLDRYIGLSPTPLGACNKYCKRREANGTGPGDTCKEIELNDAKQEGSN